MAKQLFKMIQLGSDRAVMSPESLAVVGVLPCVIVKSYFKIVYVYLDMREITEAYVMVLRASQM